MKIIASKQTIDFMGKRQIAMVFSLVLISIAVGSMVVRGLSLGFGAAVTAAMMVPVLNFLVMPAAVAGATLLWLDHMRPAGTMSESVEPGRL